MKKSLKLTSRGHWLVEAFIGSTEMVIIFDFQGQVVILYIVTQVC